MKTSESEPKPLVVEVLTRSHDRVGFASGVEPLDRYLTAQALQDKRRRVTVPYVLVYQGDNAILGYYTLSSTAVRLDALPDEIARRLPCYPNVPATLLGRLAIDRRHHGLGFGGNLLLNALRRAAAAAEEVASVAVIVDAKDDAASAFYRRFGFRAFQDDPFRLFLSMAEIRKV